MSARRKASPSSTQTELFSSPRWMEQELYAQGLQYVVGVDEAGRGPLAGPVVAAAVQLPHDLDHTLLSQLDDSKKISETKRDRLFDEIHQVADGIGVGYLCAAAIDQHNILQATFQAMQLALSQLRGKLPQPPEQILIDGKLKFAYDLPLRAIIGGDHKCRTIAAASIIAKVTRDRLMQALDQLYPAYELAAHKGYPTNKHRALIKEHGASPLHRLSFRGVLPENGDSSGDTSPTQTAPRDPQKVSQKKASKKSTKTSKAKKPTKAKKAASGKTKKAAANKKTKTRRTKKS